MAVFRYKAVTKDGQIVKNKVEESNKLSLLKKLKRNDLLPIEIIQENKKSKKIKKEKRNIESSNSVLKTIRSKEIEKSLSNKPNQLRKKIREVLYKNAKVTKRDIVVFTQNFYLLKKANFNNIHALSTILDTVENPTLKAIVEDILIGVESGENMYTTMEYYSEVFPPIYINMIKVGELSGALTTALEQAVKYIDDTVALNKKIKGILIPNLIQFAVLMLLAIGGTIWGVPIIQGVFDSVGSNHQLPALTMWFSNFLDKAMGIWYIPVSIIVVVLIGVILYIRTPKGKYNYHYFKYRMPVFGKLIYAIDFTRLIQSILLNLKNGMRIQDALETSKNISNNLVMLSLIESALNNLFLGQSWIEPFEKSGLSSPMISEMLKIGMQTDLSEMMEKLLEYMEIDIDAIMQRIIKVLPQIVYIFVGVALIFVTLVVLVPMLEVYMGGWLLEAYT